MKMKTHALVSFGELFNFIENHVGETFTIDNVTNANITFVSEQEMSKAEYNMVVLNKLLVDKTAGIVEEEKAAIEYAIECIKTLDDMGIIKENNDD